jgi:hypothetical protein
MVITGLGHVSESEAVLLSSVEVKTAWMCNSIPPYTFKTIQDYSNFTSVGKHDFFCFISTEVNFVLHLSYLGTNGGEEERV